MFRFLAHYYDKWFIQERIERFENLIIYLAALGFITHLSLIAVAKAGIGPDRLLELAGPTFFTALYTPFSFLLIYEVFVLVLALARSFSSSIAVQYQIISLIFVRRIFGDIGHLGRKTDWTYGNKWITWLGFDLIGALLLFLLVTVFLQVAQKARKPADSEQVNHFIKIKKSITLVVALTSIVIGTYYFTTSAANVAIHVFQGRVLKINIDFIFYKDLFTLLVIADVFVLLAAYFYSDEFSLVFRNIGFVISTILLRLSMSVLRPYDVVVAVGSICFGVMIISIYHYYQYVDAELGIHPNREESTS